MTPGVTLFASVEITRARGDKVGRVSRGAAKPLLAGARRAWMESGENEYSPGQCIDSLSASCAPDIDSDGRDEVGVRAESSFSGGDCDQKASNEILVPRGQRWEVAVNKAIVECGESEEPEEADVF